MSDPVAHPCVLCRTQDEAAAFAVIDFQFHVALDAAEAVVDIRAAL